LEILVLAIESSLLVCGGRTYLNLPTCSSFSPCNMISYFLPKLHTLYFSIVNIKWDNNDILNIEARRIFWIYSSTNLIMKSLFVSVLIRLTSSLIQPSCSTNMNIHRPHRTHVYNTVIISLNYRGFFRFLASCTCAPHVICLHLSMMHILETNSAEHNAQHLSVNEHTSIQYRLTVTTHEQQNTGGNKREPYVHGLPAISLKTRFNIIFSVFQTVSAKTFPYKNVC
jgi:hypothetical protein